MILELNQVDPDNGIASILDGFREDIGIDLLSVTYAEMFIGMDAFLDVLNMGTEEIEIELDFGATLHGEFDEAEITAALESAEDVEYCEISDYRGYTVYLLCDEGDDTDTASMAFIGSDTLLIGTGGSVEAMLDVAAGAAPPASGELKKALDSLGERHIGFAVELPPEFLETMMSGSEDMMPEAGLLGALDITALAAPVSAMKLLFHDDALEIEASSVFDDSEAAAASKEYSEGVVAMFGLMAAESPELQDFASGMEVSQSGNAVTFRMSISAEVIEQLIAGLGTGMMPPQN